MDVPFRVLLDSDVPVKLLANLFEKGVSIFVFRGSNDEPTTGFRKQQPGRDFGRGGHKTIIRSCAPGAGARGVAAGGLFEKRTYLQFQAAFSFFPRNPVMMPECRMELTASVSDIMHVAAGAKESVPCLELPCKLRILPFGR